MQIGFAFFIVLIVFVLLILIYARAMSRLDRKLHEEKGGKA